MSIIQIPMFPTEIPNEMEAVRAGWLNGEWHFSVIDVIAILTNSKQQARQYWNDAKQRLERETEVSEIFRQLKLEAPDGKMRLTDVATREGLFRIVQSLPSNKVTGNKVEQIKRWLARTGAQAIEDEQDPERAAIRWQGKVSRKAFMEALARSIVNMPKTGYGIMTNDIYRGLFQRTTQQLRAELNTKNPREKMSALALSYLAIAENVCSVHIGDAVGITFQQAEVVVMDVAGLIGNQIHEVETKLGIDVISGRKLLGPVDAIRGV